MDIIIDVFSYDDASIDSRVTNSSESDCIRECKYCGKKFVATGRNRSRATKCPRSHYSRCTICGSIISQDSAIAVGTKLNEVCSSRECINKLSGMKAKKAIKDKYGVDNPFQLDSVKEKSKRTNLIKYGSEYAIQSEEVKARQKNTFGSKSEKEISDIVEARKSTNISKYGVDNPAKNDAIKDKIKKTCRTRYGVDYASQSDEFRSKFNETIANRTEDERKDILNRTKATNLERYGHEYVSQVPEIHSRQITGFMNRTEEEKAATQDKRKNTCLNRYGVEHIMMMPEFRDKIKAINNDRYGCDWYSQTDESKERYAKTSIERYGVKNPMQNSEIRSKALQTNLDRYGVRYPMQSEENRHKLSFAMIMKKADSIEYPEIRKNYLDYMTDPVKYISNHFDHTPNYQELAESIGSSDAVIYSRFPTCANASLIKQSRSSMEDMLVNLLRELDPSMEISLHNRKIISPYELDIYLPDYKIGIECNPTFTHNSTLPVFNCSVMSRSYHKMKTDMCEEQGVFLFHIFGYEWTYRRDVILSMLRNLIKANSKKFYARNLEVREISSLDAKLFMDINHRQRGVYSKINLGLFTCSNEMVSCMTFGKMRNTIGRSANPDSWELVRFCNKLNSSVIGAASKLFNYFCRTYNPQSIISFSDRAHTKGTLYKTLGFNYVRNSEPNYVWVNYQNDSYYNRVTCQKQNLRKLFHDDSIDTANKTEKQIMIEHGYVQVFDSGTITWEWRST